MILQHQWGFIALALLARTAGAQGPNEVTGTAAYRERIALPPDAVFEATLEDVSRAGAAVAVIGRTRLDKSGQPPFEFSIQYDPARIEASHTYSVRARITAGGKLMFITDRSYPVLTQRKGNQVAMMIMRRAGTSTGSGTAGPAGPLGTLPASFSGEFPCADCQGIRYSLNLFPDKSFYRRMSYVGRADAKPLDDIGRWALSADGSTLMLSGGKDFPDRFAVKGSDVLRKLNVQGGEIESKFDYDLRRTSAFDRIEPRLEMRGMFLYKADAAIFTECQSGQRWPVAMEEGYKALEEAYLKTRRQPAEELLASVEGRVAMRPNMDTGKPTPTLIVERYIGIWPGETCGSPFATASLRETYWKLTRLNGQPVLLAENQREPSLVFRSKENRVTGFGGCNNLTGTYQLKDSEIAFGAIAATQMACVHGMEIEDAFFKALGNVRSWKIFGQHLELYDAGGGMIARFEARALR